MVAQLYGICGFYKPKQDINEYFLKLWDDVSSSNTLLSDKNFGYKSLYAQINWILKFFDKKTTKSTTNINSLQEIGKRLFSNLYK